MKKAMIMAVLVCLVVSLGAPRVAAADTGTTEPLTVEYHFGEYGSNGDYLSDCAKSLFMSYYAGSVNWRYEAASDTYQFRVAGKHPDVTSTGKNLFSPGALQLLGQTGWWYALRLRSPGTGKFSLNIPVSREAVVEVYFFDAAKVEAGLSESPIAYGSAMCDDPYFSADTQAFAEYKAVIGSLLENATPSMEMEAAGGKILEGAHSFQEDREYMMVIRFLNKESYRIQMGTLTATWIGEPENLPEEDEKTEPSNLGYLVPVVAAVVIAGGAVVAVVASRKKKES